MARQLRSGYTTGSCASAAAMAAAVFLFHNKNDGKKEKKGLPKQVSVCLGNGAMADFCPEYGKALEGMAGTNDWCRVKKDAGDDPDVTDGVWVYARVLPILEERFEELCHQGAGYRMKEYPKLYLNGGPGIGIAERAGLSCPVGYYAINPVPRRAILAAVETVRRDMAYEGKLEIQIAIPGGIHLAEKTFNPRLGIRGGLSILGTTGIVEPMSEQALLETIRLDIRMKAVAREPVLLLTPGNYGETFLKQELGIPLGEAVKCSNFIGDSVDFAAEEGWEKLLLAGHIGKLIKVAGGVKNTHSRYGDHRMETMERLAREVWKKMPKEQKKEMVFEKTGEEREDLTEAEMKELFVQIGKANTTEEAVGWLQKAGLAEAVMNQVAIRIKEHLSQWTEGRLKAEICVFSSAHGIVGKTERAEEFLDLWKGSV